MWLGTMPGIPMPVATGRRTVFQAERHCDRVRLSAGSAHAATKDRVDQSLRETVSLRPGANRLAPKIKGFPGLLRGHLILREGG